MHFKNLRFPVWSTPAALFILAVLAYGPLLPWLGFYWDDWPYLWVYHGFGPGGFLEYVSSDRPFSAWIFMLTTGLFGETALPYHLLALLLRWLSAVLLWQVFRMIWPAQPRQAAWASLLFLLYPGFKQQPIALIYNHHWSVLVLFLLWLVLMLLAVKKPQWTRPLTLAGIIAGLGMFSLEYFVGLELLRPLLLWIVLRKTEPNRKERIILVIRYWLPYLGLLLVYLTWRVLVFRFPTYEPEGLAAILEEPSQGLLQTAGIILADLLDVNILAWGHGLRPPWSAFSGFAIAFSVFVGVAGTVFYLSRLEIPHIRRGRSRDATAPLTNAQWSWEAAMLGVAALVLGGLPAWITNLPVHLDFPYDRLILPIMPGMALLTAALIERLLRPRTPQLLALAVLTGLALVLHFENANTYREDLQRFRDFWWQLYWRAPSLQPGTIVLTHEEPFVYYSDNSLTAPLNYIYAPGFPTGPDDRELQYMFYNVEVRLGRGLPELAPGLTVEQGYRSFSFHGSSSDILVVYQNPPGCLKVLDPATDGDLPGLTPDLAAAVPLSDLGQIIPGSEVPPPPEHLFGPEPAGTWCYYFERADLARQYGDWQEVARLGDLAFDLKDDPNGWSERLPFLEAYARTRQWDKVQNLSAELATATGIYPQTCALWSRVEDTLPLDEAEQALVAELMAISECQ